MSGNLDSKVVDDFGNEWDQYDQSNFENGFEEAFSQYFALFPDHYLNKDSVGFDAGCGSGRWARYIAPKVKKLYLLDPSKKALNVAKRNLSNNVNCIFECCSINDSSIKPESMDFGYCLGVLHHLPDTKSALKNCISKLKNGAPFLLYIYYRFDNKPFWFKYIWKISDLLRSLICILPFKVKLFVTQFIALIVYFPLSRFSLILDLLGFDISNIPLSDYRNKPFYFMTTDSLDRFGTRLEKRFTKIEILMMMKECGLSSIEFSSSPPYWVAIGYKR